MINKERNVRCTSISFTNFQGVRLAQKFEALVRSDPRFEISAARHLGLVVFHLRGENELTERLLKRLNAGGQLHCVPASLHGQYVIRFTVTSQYTTAADITKDWTVIRATASRVLDEMAQGARQNEKTENEGPSTPESRARVRLAGKIIFFRECTCIRS